MTTATSSSSIPMLLLAEGGLTAIGFAGAFLLPRIANRWFQRIERPFLQLARRKGLSVLCVGLATLLLRLALLPLIPIPLPFVPDDFSFLLAGDTFAHGRLANPTPAMWMHFESIHIDMLPTYGSMYFPAEGLLLAAGKLLFGHPWFGILISSALMCAALTWMLQAWLPPQWALLGGVLAMLRLGLFSYWVNTYTGGGTITALAGALVLGAMPRLLKHPWRRSNPWIMAAGICLLILSRPYEGLLLCLPVALILGRWILFDTSRPRIGVLALRAAPPLALIAATLAWLGYYDLKAFGKPSALPYTVNRASYAVASYYFWQAPKPVPEYRHPQMRRFYLENELDDFRKKQQNYFVTGFNKTLIALVFFSGTALMPPLLMFPWAMIDRRIRFLSLSLFFIAFGMSIEVFMIQHYLAPFTAIFYAIGLQAMRHLWVWKPEKKPVGRAIVRICVALCVGLGAVRAFAAPLGIRIQEWPPFHWTAVWSGPEQFGQPRTAVEKQLEALDGKQLVIVRYTLRHETLDEWVYNAADIDSAKVVWAREMSPANNRELLEHYRDRRAWLVEPDATPVKVTPYAEAMAASPPH